ncbi:hypothetical protein [Kytococcus sp. Marseille-QA3725]
MRRSHHLLVAATGLALLAPTCSATAVTTTGAAAAPVVHPATPRSGAPGPCSDDEGVTVVVRTPEATETRCALGDPESGEAALDDVGFDVTHDKNGMICQISVDGEPFPREEKGWKCGDFDGTNFWGYFQADGPGATWAFAAEAADQTDPAPGEVEGWSWGAGESEPPGAKAPAAGGDGSSSSPSESTGAGADPSGSAQDSPAPSEGEASPSASDSEPSPSASESSESSQVAPEGGASGLLWTLGLLAAAALAVGAWMRFGRR